MIKLRLLMLTLLVATSSLAATRHWKTAEIELTSESNVSWKLWGEKTTIHYTIETDNMVYFAEYTFKPGQHNDGRPPQIELGTSAKVAIEGSHAYVLDVTGKEVKLHNVRKIGKK
ncbi:MAG: hypothetical protein WBG02_04925 [Candidatus Acidiferrum sp.]